MVIVARGGGSLADLFASATRRCAGRWRCCACPVISSVGHHTDRTLIDDVAAVCCSTPTHAAEAAVAGRLPARARGEPGARAAGVCAGTARRAVLARRAAARAALARAAASTSRATARALHQQLREIRAGARRAGDEAGAERARARWSLHRKADAAPWLDCRQRAARELERLALALAAHDPQRTLARGYALVRVTAPASRSTTAAAAARGAASCGCASPTARSADARAMSDGRRRDDPDAASRRAQPRPTRRRRRGSRRSSGGWTRARPACARRSTLVKEGRDLIEYCAARARTRSARALEELRLDELSRRARARRRRRA